MKIPATQSRAEPRQFDLIILGGGSAAFSAALKAVELGARPLIVERDVIGGTCLNRGCVPTKNLLKAAQLFHLATHPVFPGIPKIENKVDWKALLSQKQALLNEFRHSKYYDVLKAYPQISYVEGEGRFVSATTIEVGDHIYEASKVIVATGASPIIPPIPGLDQVSYLTSTEALELENLPSELVVLGGGIVAVELAQLFSRLRSRVTVVELLPRIVSTEEPEISDALKSYLEAEGMTIFTQARTMRIFQTGPKKCLEIDVNGQSRTICAEEILVAVGRGPHSHGLNFDKVGVMTTPKGHIIVNEYLETHVPGIYAVGDVIPEKQLVTTAAMGGAIAAQNALTGNQRRMNFDTIPHAIFTDPEVASVGLSESEAHKKGASKFKILQMNQVPKAGAIRDTKGLVKMVVDAKTERILGIHILAPQAADIIHQAVYIVKSKLTVQDVVDTIYVYPTLSESIKMLAQSFKTDVTKRSCCA